MYQENMSETYVEIEEKYIWNCKWTFLKKLCKPVLEDCCKMVCCQYDLQLNLSTGDDFQFCIL